MNHRLTATVAVAILIGALAGCNKAETPAEVRHDVNEAQADANTKVADAQADAAKDVRDPIFPRRLHRCSCSS